MYDQASCDYYVSTTSTIVFEYYSECTVVRLHTSSTVTEPWGPTIVFVSGRLYPGVLLICILQSIQNDV